MMATASPGTSSSPSRLLFVTDPTSRYRFLVDTGASVSVIPASRWDRRQTAGNSSSLKAANGTPIATFGETPLVLSLGLRRQFRWVFLRADVSHAILGIDFLSHFSLHVDLGNRCLLDPVTSLSVVGEVCTLSSSSPSVHLLDSNHPCYAVLAKYPQITAVPANLHAPVKHSVTHAIATHGPPVFSRARRLAPDRLQAAKAEFDHMLASGVIQPSTTQYASPLHMVRKKNGEWRPCGDFRALNSSTRPDRYSLPHLHDFTSSLDGATVFTTLDLAKAYYQIPVASDDVHKTAVITPFGSFEFLRMPFGLRNASQTFQRFLDQVLHGLPFVFGYIDDLLIASASMTEHLQHLDIVLQRLTTYGLVIQPQKCTFAASSVEFLGHQVSATGICPLPSKVQAISDFPLPTSARQLRRFIGMVNFYRRFVPHCADLLSPLHDLLNSKQKNHSIVWTQATEEAFASIKQAVTSATLLVHPTVNASLSLVTDASDIGVGAVLHQVIDSQPQPLAFFSKKLERTQQRYSTFDRELLAIYLAVRHFRHFLEGRCFHILTDHKPITFAMHTDSSRHSPRVQRQLSFISEFTADIRHIKGSQNTVADALSRAYVASISDPDSAPLDFTAMAAAQATDDELRELRASSSTSRVWKDVTLPAAAVPLICDVSSGSPRPFVPESFRRSVFCSLHSLSHPGIRGSRRLISDHYIWPGMRKDIKQWVTVMY